MADPEAINSLPIVQHVQLVPEKPSFREALEVRYTYYDVDNDLQGATIIRWDRNGEVQPEFDNQSRVPISATATGQTWCAVVIPHDGKDYGVSSKSNCVLIGDETNNTPPKVDNVYIEPALPASVKPLHLRYEYNDPDGDVEVDSRIRWYKNGEPQPEFDDNTTIPSDRTQPGEHWHATIEPHDGSAYGEQISALSVTINHPPQLDAASVTAVESSLTVSYSGYQDIDGDPPGHAGIHWQRNDQVQPALADLEVVSVCGMMIGDHWFAEVAPHDGIEYGQTVTTNLVTVAVNKICLHLPYVVYNVSEENRCTNTNFNEENDNRVQACGLLPGKVYEAYPDDNEDIYYFVLYQTSSVHLTVTNYRTTEAGKFLIYDSFDNKHYLVRLENLQGTATLPNQQDPHALESLPPGKYYVRIYTPSDHVNSTNPYQLTITIDPS
ncbi:MAG: hypothetical protein R2867_21470 [Caldilineaceae bacterium]